MSHGSLFLSKGPDIKRCGVALGKCIVFSSRKKHYDIAIAGGGLVGTAMACALAQNKKLSEKSVGLFESAPERVYKKSVNDEYSNRVVSINPSTRKFFEELGLWKHISDVRYKTIKKLQVWDASSDTTITFNDELVDDVSYVVENDVIMQALQTVCSEHKNIIEVNYQSQIKHIELPTTQKHVTIEMENSDKHTCCLLIGADGVNSKTRSTMDPHYLSWSYNQKGIVATLKLSEPTENIVAWQRFLPTGPVALLPLTDELSSLVWSIGTEEAEQLMKLSDESFVDAVNDAFWKCYPKSDIVTSLTDSFAKILDSLMLNSGSVKQLPPSISSVIPKSRAAFPLGFGHSSVYVAPGVALIGDAAHRIHPLAGQGVNLGFKDVECLTKVLAESVYAGNMFGGYVEGIPRTEHGSYQALLEYQSERQYQIVPMLAATDLLHKLYSTEFTPVVLLRSLGLQLTNSLNPVKKLITEKASA